MSMPPRSAPTAHTHTRTHAARTCWFIISRSTTGTAFSGSPRHAHRPAATSANAAAMARWVVGSAGGGGAGAASACVRACERVCSCSKGPCTRGVQLGGRRARTPHGMHQTHAATPTCTPTPHPHLLIRRARAATRPLPARRPRVHAAALRRRQHRLQGERAHDGIQLGHQGHGARGWGGLGTCEGGGRMHVRVSVRAGTCKQPAAPAVRGAILFALTAP